MAALIIQAKNVIDVPSDFKLRLGLALPVFLMPGVTGFCEGHVQSHEQNRAAQATTSSLAEAAIIMEAVAHISCKAATSEILVILATVAVILLATGGCADCKGVTYAVIYVIMYSALLTINLLKILLPCIRRRTGVILYPMKNASSNTNTYKSFPPNPHLFV